MTPKENKKYAALLKKCTAYNKANLLRKKGMQQYELFCQWLLQERRCTKEEMKPFFKRKTELKKKL